MDELQNYNGRAEDTRSEEEKAKDYTHVEGLGMAVITPDWKEKTSRSEYDRISDGGMVKYVMRGH